MVSAFGGSSSNQGSFFQLKGHRSACERPVCAWQGKPGVSVASHEGRGGQGVAGLDQATPLLTPAGQHRGTLMWDQRTPEG